MNSFFFIEYIYDSTYRVNTFFTKFSRQMAVSLANSRDYNLMLKQYILYIVSYVMHCTVNFKSQVKHLHH